MSIYVSSDTSHQEYLLLDITNAASGYSQNFCMTKKEIKYISTKNLLSIRFKISDKDTTVYNSTSETDTHGHPYFQLNLLPDSKDTREMIATDEWQVNNIQKLENELFHAIKKKTRSSRTEEKRIDEMSSKSYQLMDNYQHLLLAKYQAANVWTIAEADYHQLINILTKEWDFKDSAR
ncbi:hypothetical protein C1940_17470 (plasmid) [Lactiplantibacillus plantarum subsp. plantarum]|uniref:hypothetical protein n=1 Tax=Lactiplantibacillus plantarum TaxID=1590 RepID=UPI000CD36082|nr:hypothetical protein [Lactiplantibacillus plantarum]AUV74241.1 hypothetical protein C1940_17470 [Lactiplantibacillus plantarum subsp. plantarum]